MAISRSIFAVVAVFSTFLPLSAQWLNYPTPGIPRTPDGKPNLSAPAPRTPDGKPDFSGIWATRSDTRFFQDLSAGGAEIPMLPSAKKLYEQRKADLQKGHPSERCLGHGVADFDTHQTPRRIIQSPGVIAILFESYHQYRQILMDGRPLPQIDQPAFFGYSVGRWEGDTLIVDTIGFNEGFWFSRGIPHTDRMHMVERFTRTDYNTTKYEVTVDDPGAYTQPWTAGFLLRWELGTELFEYICQDNNFAPELMVGSQESIDRSTPIVP